jgi:signal transduction histidine kinase
LLKIQQEEASKLNAILNSIADGVIVQDLAGETLITNPAAEAILEKMGEGFTPAQLQERAAEGDQSQVGDSSPWLTALTGLEFHETKRFEMGHQVLSALSAPVVTPDGQQLGSVVVLRDITREVESERLKDDFITSVSHELRTPLTAIKGYNELLRMTGAGRLDDQQLQFIDTINENVADLLNLIQEMLDISQIEAGALGIDQEPVNLAELIEAEAQKWRQKMMEKELAFDTNLSTEPVWVEGDWNRLTRVLHNLVSNAYAYTLPGGKVEISLRQENGLAQVDVVDTGVGISEENQRFLFTRFFRAIHEESTYDISGAGLGLYISKAIIEAHNGGKIWVETGLNQGSTFSFTLPVIDPVNQDDAEPESVGSGIRR